MSSRGIHPFARLLRRYDLRKQIQRDAASASIASKLYGVCAVNLTYKAVQEQLRAIGIVVSKRDKTHRINFFGGVEETAYYTDSLSDAFVRGSEMARSKQVRTTVAFRPST